MQQLMQVPRKIFFYLTVFHNMMVPFETLYAFGSVPVFEDKVHVRSILNTATFKTFFCHVHSLHHYLF